MRLSEPQSHFECGGEEKEKLHLPEKEPKPSSLKPLQVPLLTEKERNREKPQ
jgi:hypothetical protein